MNGSFLAAIITDAVLIAAVVIIVPRYRLVWHDWLCMLEPFTYWFARISKAHPIFWWGGVATACAVVIATVFMMWLWRITGIIGTAFFGWFIPHIIDAANRQCAVNEYNPINPVDLIHMLKDKIRRERNDSKTKRNN